MQQLQITAPAKINLTLDILGKRPDGYHDLVTVMHQIDLADNVLLKRQEKGITLDCGRVQLPNDSKNLAWQAAELMLKRYELQDGVSISITKRIPVEAGLAGGSSDAAAVIAGMNRLFSLNLPLAELCDCGVQLGADVPFCIVGGTALCTGKGEVMQPLPHAPHLYLVVVKPAFSLSTAMVYQQFDRMPIQEHLNHAAFLQAWETQKVEDIALCTGNVLEKASLALKPEIGVLIAQLQNLGALAAHMTGSGSAVFGVFGNNSAAHAAAGRLSEAYAECFVAESFTPKID